MRRFLLNILLLTATLLPFVAKAQVAPVIVAEGTQTNASVPISGYYADDSYQRCQIIYPQSLVGDLAGSSVSGIKFYISTPGVSSTTGDTIKPSGTVKIGTSSLAAFTDAYDDDATLTTVYTGEFNLGRSELNINFSSPWTYTGGNIIIEVDITTLFSTYGNAYFQGSASTGASIWARSTSSFNEISSPSAWGFMPKIAFMVPVSCGAPENFTLGTTTTSGASFSWSAPDGGAAGGYYFEYKQASADSWTSANVTSTSYTLTGLSSGTNYIAKVRAICAPGDTSFSASLQFATEACDVALDEGGSTSQYVPLRGFYDYSYSQSLYMAYELDDIDTIRGISFNATATNGLSQKLDIYLGNTSASTLTTSAYVAVGDMTKVVSDYSITFASGWNYIPFDTPFEYDGSSNLVIAVDNNTGDYANGLTFSHHSSTGGSCYWYQDDSDINPTSPSASNEGALTTVPDIKFAVSCNDNGCAQPIASLGEISDNSIIVNWAAGGSETEWVVMYKLATAADWTTVGIISTNTYTFTGLSSNTSYKLRIGAICGSDTTFATLSATTLCGAVTVPYSENFNSYTTNNRPDCFTVVQANSSYPYITSSGQEGNGLNFYAYSSSPNMIATPMLDREARTCMVEFDAKIGNYSSAKLCVGVITDPSNSTTFTAVDTIVGNVNGNTWKSYEVDLSTYSAIASSTAKYVAFQFIGSSDAAYIDNLMISVASDCKKPTSGSISNVTPATAQISWTAADLATEYEVAYGTSSNVNEATIVSDITATNHTLTGLAAETQYYVWVRTVCGAELTNWRSIGNFTTTMACAPVLSAAISSVVETGIAFSWSIDTTQGYPSTTVEVAYQQDGESDWTTITTNDNFYVLTGLNSGATYTIRIRNICSTDTSQAITLNATTASCAEVGDGSSSTNYLPTYAYYKYDYTQMIYKADEIGQFDTIRGIAFNYTSLTNDSRTITVYIGDVENASLTDGAMAITDFTQVVSNYTWNLATGWCNIPFTTPFVHEDGKDIVIAVQDNTGSYTSSRYFAAHAGSGYYYYQDASSISTTNPSATYQSASSVVPDIRFDVTCDAPSCPAPLLVVSDVDNSSVDLLWTPMGTESSWNVEYKLTSDTVWEVAATNVTTTNYTVTDLSSGAYYHLRVIANCDGETASSTVSAFTDCGIADVPYSEDFSSGQLNPCWVIGNDENSGYEPYISSGQLYGTYWGGGYVILPEFSTPINQLMVQFDARIGYSGYDGEIQVGVVPNQSSINGFTSLESFDISSTSLQEQIAYLDSYTGSGYIAIKFVDDYMYIDNLLVAVAPPCHKPTHLTVVSTTSNSATLSWNHSATSFEVRYRTGNGEWATTTVGASPATVTGLLDATSYEFQVRALCDATETSDWSTSATGATTCVNTIITSTDSHEENFDAISSGIPMCWDQEASSSYYDWSVSIDGHSGKSMYFSGYYGYSARLISPVYDCSALNNGAQLRFWYRNPESDGVFGTINVYYRNSATGNWTIVSAGAISQATSTWTEMEVSLPNSTAASFYQVSILATSSTSYDNTYMYIDDYVVEAAPTCARPTDITLLTAGATTATLAWTTTAPNTLVNYRKANTTNWSSVTASGNSVTLTGLTSATQYEVQLSAICSDDDQSPLSNTFVFRTNCYDDAISTFPWVEGFENGIFCWQQEFITGTDEWITKAGDGETSYHLLTSAYAGSNNALFYTYTAGNSTRIVSPAFNTTTLAEPYLKYAYALPPYNGTCGKLQVYYRTAPTSSWVELKTYNTEVSQWTVDSVALPVTSAEFQISFVATYNSLEYGIVLDQVTVYNTGGTIEGIDDINGNFSLNLYPNPATGSTTISMEGVSGTLKVDVVDMSGRMVLTETVQCNEGCTKQLNVSNLAQGTYFVRVTGQEVNTVKKLIVR